MSSIPAEDTQKLSKTQVQSLVPLSAPDAVCPSSTPTGNETFVPLSLSEQICAIALIEAYLTEWIGGDVHYLACRRAIDRSIGMGVNEQNAFEIVAKFASYRKNPAPGFM